MARANALTTLLRSITQWFVGEPFVFYRVTFKDGTRTPIIDLYHLGDLKTTTSTNISGYTGVFSATPALGPGTSEGGIALRLTRPTHADPALPTINGGLVVLNPFPADASVLMVRATGFQLEGPHAVTDAWGPVVHAREGDLADVAQSPTAIRLALQTAVRVDPGLLPSGTPGVRMVTPGGTPSGLDEWFPDSVFQELFPTLLTNITIEHSAFTLDLRISRWGPPAVASFCSRSYSKIREFEHREIARAGNLTAAGVNIAIPAGAGPRIDGCERFPAAWPTGQTVDLISDRQDPCGRAPKSAVPPSCSCLA
jgi:hypothetical protein